MASQGKQDVHTHLLMPYGLTSELPEAVRNALPPRALRVFMVAFNGAAKRGLSEESSFKSAWGAVRAAGWSKSPGDGKWVKKQQPSIGQVHIDRPMGSDDEDDQEDEDGEKKAKSAISLRFDITKTVEDQNLVFGWLSVIEQNGESVVDLQGHVIDEATMEAAAYDMVLNGCDAGEMHERIGIGSGLIECVAFTREKQTALGIDLGKVGLWVGFRVDAEAFSKVKDGTLRSFSLGGIGVLEDMPEAA